MPPSSTTTRYASSLVDAFILYQLVILISRLQIPFSSGRTRPGDPSVVSGITIGRASCSTIPLERTHDWRGVSTSDCWGSNTTYTASDAGEHTTQVILDARFSSRTQGTLYSLRQRRITTSSLFRSNAKKVAMVYELIASRSSIIRGGICQGRWPSRQICIKASRWFGL